MDSGGTQPSNVYSNTRIMLANQLGMYRVLLVVTIIQSCTCMHTHTHTLTLSLSLSLSLSPSLSYTHYQLHNYYVQGNYWSTRDQGWNWIRDTNKCDPRAQCNIRWRSQSRQQNVNIFEVCSSLSPRRIRRSKHCETDKRSDQVCTKAPVWTCWKWWSVRV